MKSISSTQHSKNFPCHFMNKSAIYIYIYVPIYIYYKDK